MSLAIAEPEQSSSSPVCFCRENLNRLVSLWDIVNYFDTYGLFLLFNKLMTYECALATGRRVGQGGMLVPADDLREIIAIIDSFHSLSEMGDLAYLRDDCVTAKFQLSKSGPVDYSSGQTTLSSFKIAFVSGLRKRKFLSVDEDRCKYLDQRALFGTEVSFAFPSSSRDLKEAGNCLACECSTGSVFHLMRAAEFALRALARDRDVSFKDKPLEDKQWGEILGALEGKITILRNADRKNWALSEARDAQMIFYNEVVQELRGFNDAWRRHLSHADVLAFYEPDTALGILKHVRTFMQKLSLKLSETSVTPQYWTTA